MIYGLGFTSPGEYFIDPTGAGEMAKAKEVHCFDGHTVILSRMQAGNDEAVRKLLVTKEKESIKCVLHLSSQYFHRPMLDYKKGFGDPSDEYWIGLETLNA